MDKKYNVIITALDNHVFVEEQVDYIQSIIPKERYRWIMQKGKGQYFLTKCRENELDILEEVARIGGLKMVLMCNSENYKIAHKYQTTKDGKWKYQGIKSIIKT